MDGNAKEAPDVSVPEGVVVVTEDSRQQRRRQRIHQQDQAELVRDTSIRNRLNFRRTSGSSIGFSRSMTPTSASSSVSPGQSVSRVMSTDKTSCANRESEDNVSMLNRHFRSLGSVSSVAHLVRHEGYLSGWGKKFSPHYGTGWQKRYFCLLERDLALAYWRSVPQYADEQPAGSINLRNVYSIELEGGSGIILRCLARDYRLLFDLPSTKDKWYNRILAVFHCARKNIGDNSRDSASNKFATWAYAQQKQSGSGLSTVLHSLRRRHSQIFDSTLGMGPTTDQVDVKRKLLQHFLLYQLLHHAFSKSVSHSPDYEIPLECYIPDVQPYGVGSSPAYSYAFAMNVYYLYNKQYDLEEPEEDDSSPSLCNCTCFHEALEDRKCCSPEVPFVVNVADFDQDFSSEESPPEIGKRSLEDTPLKASLSEENPLSDKSTPSHTSDTNPSLVLRSSDINYDSASSISSSSSSSSICLPQYQEQNLGATTLLPTCSSCRTNPSECCSLPITRPLHRSASLDSIRAQALRHIRFQTPTVTDNHESLQQRPWRRLIMIRGLLGLSRDQANTWRLNLREEKSRSIDLSDLSRNRSKLLLHQSSSPLVSNTSGVARPVISKEIEFLPAAPYSKRFLRPAIPGDTKVPALRDPTTPMVALNSETAAELFRCSVMGFSDDLIRADRLCHALDGVHRLTESRAIGSMEKRPIQQRLARCLYERSSPCPMDPVVDYLLTTTETVLSEVVQPENVTDALLNMGSPLRRGGRSAAMSSCSSASSRGTLIFKEPTRAIFSGFDDETFLDNIVLGHLEVSLSYGSYTPYLAIIISSCAIGSGKCFDIRRSNLNVKDNIVFPSGYCIDGLHLFPIDTIAWPLPSDLQPRDTPPTPTSVIHLPQCHHISRVVESEFGFEWTCKETSLVRRRFHDGMKKVTNMIWFRARTEREANMFRQSMISSKLASLSETQRSRVLRGWYRSEKFLPPPN